MLSTICRRHPHVKHRPEAGCSAKRWAKEASESTTDGEPEGSAYNGMPLRHAPAGDPRVLDNAPVARLFAILPANFAAQKHDGRQYRHIGGGENRLGRLYSRFSGLWLWPSCRAITCSAKIAERRVESAKTG
jgi:hypothetical protein